MAFSAWLYFFVLLTLCNQITGDIDCLKSCDMSRNFIILFDEFQSMENLWATQVFVSKLGRSLRTHSEDNRVAIGTFQGIKSSLEDSLYRRSTAFEQAILDLDITPSSDSLLGTAIDVLKPLVSGVHKCTSVLFIIASKGRDDEENKKIESKVIALFKAATNVSGHAIGIGEYIHEGSFAALSGYPKSGRGWMVDSVSNLDDIEGRILTKLLCDHKISPTVAFVTLYSEQNLQGSEVTVNFQDYTCKDVSGLMEGKNISSLQNHKQCIALYDEPGCLNGLLTVFEDQAGVLNLTESPNRKPYKYIGPCEVPKPTTDKKDYIYYYRYDSYAYSYFQVDRSPSGGCNKLELGGYTLKSAHLFGNCVILYDNDKCEQNNKTQRIAQNREYMSKLPMADTKSIKFCN